MTARLDIAAGVTLADLAGFETRSGSLALTLPQSIAVAKQIGGGPTWKLMEGDQVLAVAGFLPVDAGRVGWLWLHRDAPRFLVPLCLRMRRILADHQEVARCPLLCEVHEANPEGRRLARLLGFRPVSRSDTGILTHAWRSPWE